ncbi:MAG: hypothetical protein AB2531_10700, partial [Candidatus Thiodiazotropha sp.]
MNDSRIVKRYNAYYRGWCLAFGEHTADYDEAREISWLFGEDRIGMILSSRLRKQAQHELLGHHDEIPQLLLSDDSVGLNHYKHPLQDDIDTRNIRRLKAFMLSGEELHMFLCSHLFYPPHTRILTFATKKPLIIMYNRDAAAGAGCRIIQPALPNARRRARSRVIFRRYDEARACCRSNTCPAGRAISTPPGYPAPWPA